MACLSCARIGAAKNCPHDPPDDVGTRLRVKIEAAAALAAGELDRIFAEVGGRPTRKCHRRYKEQWPSREDEERMRGKRERPL